MVQYERSMIRLRLRSGKARKAALGGFVGGQVPLGFRAVEGTLVPDDVEQQTLARAVELAERTGLSLRAIGAVLDADGRRPKRGGSWRRRL